MKKLLIYCDRGVSQKSYQETLNMCHRLGQLKKWSIETASARVINYESWQKKTNLLIIPGGRETPYYEDLCKNGQGHQRILDFVDSGGSYLGICAGAYYGASRIVFENGHPENEIITSRSLGLYSGEAEGPAYGLGVFQYQSEVGARTALISSHMVDNPINQPFPVYFNGGCWFHSHKEDSDTQIIARYADLEKQPAAIINCSYGKGHVSLSGVHFEYKLQDSNQNHRDKFIRQLACFN